MITFLYQERVDHGGSTYDRSIVNVSLLALNVAVVVAGAGDVLCRDIPAVAGGRDGNEEGGDDGEDGKLHCESVKL